MSTGVLVATELRRSFGGRQVVNGVSLSLIAGQVVGLLGPNGAGKTTTFRMLAGLLAPDSGTVHIGGEEVTSWPLHRRVAVGLGYLPQGSTIFRGLSVLENVFVALEVAGRDRELANEILAGAGLTHIAESPVDSLSGGERRRLEIARCLAVEPRVVLLDEPFAGVDPVGVAGLREQIRELARTGLAVLLTDHAVRDALGACDQAIILDGGEVQAEGSPEEVAIDPRVRDRYLGTDFTL